MEVNAKMETENAFEYNQEKQRRDKALWSHMSEEEIQAVRRKIQRNVKKHFAKEKNED